MADRARIVLDLTGPARESAPALLSGSIEGYVDGRRVYRARLTDADEAELDETFRELAKVMVDAGVERVPGGGSDAEG
jgi:hypothetical protein